MWVLGVHQPIDFSARMSPLLKEVYGGFVRFTRTIQSVAMNFEERGSGVLSVSPHSGLDSGAIAFLVGRLNMGSPLREPTKQQSPRRFLPFLGPLDSRLDSGPDMGVIERNASCKLLAVSPDTIREVNHTSTPQVRSLFRTPKQPLFLRSQ